MEHESQKTALVLPVSVVSRVDISRLVREIETIEDFLTQAAIRLPGTGVKLPRTSRLFDEMVSANHLNVLHANDRKRLHTFLISVRAKAPLLHISFSADPSPLVTQKLMTWLRREIHPWVLLQVGLQPNMGAGCVVRTTNKYFDFSLRQHFNKQRRLLISKIQGAPEQHEAPLSAAGAP